MSNSTTEEICAHPKFKQLVHTRLRLSLFFSLFIFIGYCIFVLGMAFAPSWMATPFSTGSSITYGIIIAIFMIVAGMLSSGIYMKMASSSFDSVKLELLKEINHE